MPFGISFRKKDEGKVQREHELRSGIMAAEEMHQVSPEAEYIAQMGKMGYLLMDERVITVLFQNKSLRPFIFDFSPLNATVYLNKRQEELKRIRLENRVTMTKLTMDPRDYEENGLEVLEGMRVFGHDQISGASEGWKGRIATEQVKVHKFPVEGKGGILRR